MTQPNEARIPPAPQPVVDALTRSVLGTISLLGAGASILSVVLLISHGFDVGFVAPLLMLLDYYQAFVSWALDWASPYLVTLLDRLSSVLDLHLTLHAHWQHVFILMWLYLSGDFRAYWERKRRKSAIGLLIFGAIIALASSIGSGVVPLDDPRLLVVIFPVAGFVFYEAAKSPWSAWLYRRKGDSWWGTCRYYLVAFAATNLLAGTLAYAVGLAVRSTGFSSPGLLALFVFFILLVIRNFVMGARYAKMQEANGGSWQSRFFQSATARLGIFLASILIGALLFIVLNAGLKLVPGL